MTKPTGRPVGRPSKYNEALAIEICEQLMAGESLVAICQRDDMPNRITVVRWMDRDPDFATMIFKARATQADLMDDLVLEIAKNCKYETAAADAVRLKALSWRAARLNAKRYGEKTSQEVTQKHEITHIHLVAPDDDERVTLDGDFTLLPHPLEQE
jgi:hypothetical protein